MANIGVVFIVLIMFGITPHWRSIFFPLTVIPLVLLGVGVGMFVSVVAVVAHDVSKMVSSALGLLMFLTPVLYAPTLQNKTLEALIWWNPLTYLVEAARETILYGRISHIKGYVAATAISVAIFLFSWRLFFLSARKVAEKL
jgi:lipopolysaccharide transport system permease protein